MGDPERVLARFTGERAGSAPLTWGQAAIWKAVESVAPDDHWLNVRRVIVVPGRRAVRIPELRTAVGRLVTRHEALRTLIQPAGAGPVQVVVPAGQLEIAMVEVDVDVDPGATPRRLIELNDSVCAPPVLADATDAMLCRLAGERFDYATAWPLRVGAVVDGPSGLVRHVVLVFSHVAVDWHAAEQVVRDLRMLLARGVLPTRDALRPLELAAREQTAGRRTERAVAHWLRAYQRIPTEPFPLTLPAAQPRYRQAILTSPALRTAVPLVAARHAMSTSTVLLAATAAVIGAATGHGACGLLTIGSNRFQAGHGSVIAPMNQLALIALDLAGVGLDDPACLDTLVPVAWRAALEAYQHGYYDQVALDLALAGAGHDPGDVTVAPFCCFNDLRADGDRALPAGLAEPLPVADRSRLRLALRDTTVDWLSMASFNWRFYLEVRSAPGALGLVLTADTMAMPPERLERLLRQLELLVVESALRG